MWEHANVWVEHESGTMFRPRCSCRVHHVTNITTRSRSAQTRSRHTNLHIPSRIAQQNRHLYLPTFSTPTTWRKAREAKPRLYVRRTSGRKWETSEIPPQHRVPNTKVIPSNRSQLKPLSYAARPVLIQTNLKPATQSPQARRGATMTCLVLLLQ
jgi:hypothetical protein